MLEIENIYDSYKYSQARTMSQDWIGMRATAVSINRRANRGETAQLLRFFFLQRPGSGPERRLVISHVASRHQTCRWEEAKAEAANI
jgi:hypothetical protein